MAHILVEVYVWEGFPDGASDKKKTCLPMLEM